MTDHMIPADEVRKIIAAHSDGARRRAGVILAALEALLPSPPTLADMTLEERRACQWMQADVEGQEPSAVITYPDRGSELVKLIDRWGKMIYAGSNLVTPRPDLPRMEWPGDTPHKGPKVTFSMPAPTAPAKVGDVIESADDPRLADLPIGSMLIDRDGGVFDVTKNYTGEWDGPGYVPAQGTGTKWGPWTVRRIGLVADQ